ncbi:hypothetical protein FOZG_17015 [Fusarium oxysporum Fo47]|uniref:Uncharacterized protein n=1 Tax=Fusarium oxysporum Fo47 TaxID=660027 RepID=W9JBF9_FUSOX|nr:hypothetical protein FOZG_17015 [Fusarium oxysporum Fo47]
MSILTSAKTYNWPSTTVATMLVCHDFRFIPMGVKASPGARNDESQIEVTGYMAASVEKKTNKWPKDVDNDKEYSENDKPVRDLKFRTVNSAMTGSDIG